ncbi:MAG: poly-gamma-glutamate synthesis protein [Myxococcales bacterium]|nr:poly-gamma-glutamate synthesis protein [Myxococcales bacterium]
MAGALHWGVSLRWWTLVAFGAVACRGKASPDTAARPPIARAMVATVASPPPAATASAPRNYGCDPSVPAAACASFRSILAKRRDLHFVEGAPTKLAPCARDAPGRVGEWRYSLIAPLYSPIQDEARDGFLAMWRGEANIRLAMTPETHAMLATQLGAGASQPLDGHPVLSSQAWAIVPADELVPQWSVVAIDHEHPLAAARDGVLTVALCAEGADVAVRNIDPAQITTLAMTGVTAMARFTAKLMDKKGTTYPARDVASWFAGIDFVHVSNEVSFVPACAPKGDPTEPFCSKDSYIELLEAIHTNILELDGSHLADFGRETFAHTLDMYDARGWQHFGGGRDQLDATKPLLLEHHGNKIALIGCNMPHSTSQTIRNGPDVGYCDMQRVDWQIRDLKKRGYVPIVSIQHEEVYKHDPPEDLVDDFRKLASAGAAVVFGSQAHWAHPFEVYAGAYVHYGAGNFFFDQSWAEARDATADRFYFHGNRLLTVGHLFTRLEEAGRPRPMTETERAGFLTTLQVALDKLPKADPWGVPRQAPSAPGNPDSFLLGKEAILLGVALPEGFVDQHFPLVIDLHAKAATAGQSLCVTLRKSPKVAGKRLTTAITSFMVAKYAVDPARVTVR